MSRVGVQIETVRCGRTRSIALFSKALASIARQPSLCQQVCHIVEGQWVAQVHPPCTQDDHCRETVAAERLFARHRRNPFTNIIPNDRPLTQQPHLDLSTQNRATKPMDGIARVGSMRGEGRKGAQTSVNKKCANVKF